MSDNIVDKFLDARLFIYTSGSLNMQKSTASKRKNSIQSAETLLVLCHLVLLRV